MAFASGAGIIMLISLLLLATHAVQAQEDGPDISVYIGMVGASCADDTWDEALDTGPWGLGGPAGFPILTIQRRLRQEHEGRPDLSLGFTTFHYYDNGSRGEPTIRLFYIGPNMRADAHPHSHVGLFCNLGVGYQRLSFRSPLHDDVSQRLGLCGRLGIEFQVLRELGLGISGFYNSVSGTGFAGISIEVEPRVW
jgi:hypothetical protein